jgi:internalin A
VHYNVLPGSIISRFIVRMHRYIHQNTVWRTGVLLALDEGEEEEKGNHALVKADYPANKIYVWVRGPAYGRRELLTRIREQLDAIRDTIQGLQAAEKVPIPGHSELAPVDYKWLRDLERAGRAEFTPPGFIDPLSVRQLLDGVEPQTTRIPHDAKYNVNVYGGQVGVIGDEPEVDAKYNVNVYGGQVGVIGDEPEVKGGIHFESDKDYHR